MRSSPYSPEPSRRSNSAANHSSQSVNAASRACGVGGSSGFSGMMTFLNPTKCSRSDAGMPMIDRKIDEGSGSHHST